MMAIFSDYYLKHEVTRYVILFIERDGSTYLSNLLASHPDIRGLSERFGTMRQKGLGAKDQLDWARSFLTPSLIGRKAAIGFKTKIRDVLDLQGFAELLAEKRCCIVKMSRRNRVKAVVSGFTAPLFTASHAGCPP